MVIKKEKLRTFNLMYNLLNYYTEMTRYGPQ